MLVVIATDDAANLGILSSHVHVVFGRCALVGGSVSATIRAIPNHAALIPSHSPTANNIQSRLYASSPKNSTLTASACVRTSRTHTDRAYNVLEQLRAGTKPGELDEHDITTFDDGLLLIMKELHDRLECAVAEAYGPPADLSDDEALARLVALNKERSEEESAAWCAGSARTTRFRASPKRRQAGGRKEGAQVAAETHPLPSSRSLVSIWARGANCRIFATLAAASDPLNAKVLAAQFRRTKTTEKKVSECVASLARLGYVTSEDGKTYACGAWPSWAFHDRQQGTATRPISTP